MSYPPDHLLSFRRDKFSLHSKAIVCQDVELKGDITIGSGVPNFHVSSLLVLKLGVPGTIVHPKATIFAIAGPIIIGMGCIIEEGAIIVNRYVLNFHSSHKLYLSLLHQAKRGYANWRREPFRNWLSCVFLS